MINKGNKKFWVTNKCVDKNNKLVGFDVIINEKEEFFDCNKMKRHLSVHGKLNKSNDFELGNISYGGETDYPLFTIWGTKVRKIEE